MNSTYSHPSLGSVTLVTRRGLRRVSLSVRPSGEVRLTYPWGVSREEALRFLESRIGWIERARERLAARERIAPEPTREEIESLRRAAKEDLPLRIARLSEATGLRYTKLMIRASRSRWGSCSAANGISLSLFLMRLPDYLRDFVILHELCHTRHHNHSDRFHALLDGLVGGREKELNRELRRYTLR